MEYNDSKYGAPDMIGRNMRRIKRKYDGNHEPARPHQVNLHYNLFRA